MTDNTEREEFEKVWPVPMGIRWHDGMYVSEDAEFIKLTLRACYQSAWKGFQAGRASGIQHAIATLKPPVEALFAHIESSRDAVIDADLQKDAARYRWLRMRDMKIFDDQKGTEMLTAGGLQNELDAYMDAVISGS